jgi:hypothetical protein
MTTTTRALLLLLLLFGTAAISLAQSNNSTGALSSTGESLLIETNKDTDWQKAYDWLIFDHWGWFTMGTTFLGVVFFAALLYTCYTRNQTRKTHDLLSEPEATKRGSEAQAATKGHVKNGQFTISHGGFSTIALNEDGEEEEDENSSNNYTGMKPYYEIKRSRN